MHKYLPPLLLLFLFLTARCTEKRNNFAFSPTYSNIEIKSCFLDSVLNKSDNSIYTAIHFDKTSMDKYKIFFLSDGLIYYDKSNMKQPLPLHSLKLANNKNYYIYSGIERCFTTTPINENNKIDDNTAYVKELNINTWDDTRNDYPDSSKTVSALRSNFESIKPDTLIQKLLLEYIKRNPCKDCINELYIDEQTPQYLLGSFEDNFYKNDFLLEESGEGESPVTVVLTIKSEPYSESYIKERMPLFCLNVNGVNFYIYSGLEYFFEGDNIKNIESDTKNTECNIQSWCILYTGIYKKGHIEDKTLRYLFIGPNSPFEMKTQPWIIQSISTGTGMVNWIHMNTDIIEKLNYSTMENIPNWIEPYTSNEQLLINE